MKKLNYKGLLQKFYFQRQKLFLESVTEDLDFLAEIENLLKSVCNKNLKIGILTLKLMMLQPYCFSNVKPKVELWYEWFYEVFQTHIPMKTKHRR